MKNIKLLKEPMTFAQAFCLLVVTMCFFGIMWALWFLVHNNTTLKDPTAVAVIMFILGCLKSGWDSVVKFITASSASSAAKDDAQIATTNKLTDAAINSTPIGATDPTKNTTAISPLADK